ncbi:MAG: AI-2E family transporter [Muribaculaceae bacterium]|nr:AI-2E family transporter [Muribaculaceae bacterium]
METTAKKYDLDRVVRMVTTITTVGIGVFLINYLSPVLWPFLLGFLLAYMLDPVVCFIQRITRLKSRLIPVIITLLMVIAIIFMVCWYLIPYIFEEFADMTNMLAKYAKGSFHVPYIPSSVHDFMRSNIDVNHISSLLSREQWMKLINNVVTSTWSVLDRSMSILFSAVSSLIVLLYMVFVLLDIDKLSRTFKAALPKQYRYTGLRVINDVKNTMSRYFRGQALVSLCVGVIFAIEFYIIGLPMAVVFGLSVGVLNMVPYLQLVSIPVAAFLCVVAAVASGGSFWALFGWTFGAYCLCQVIQDLILVPAIMKQQMGLNPAIIFLSLSLWGYVLGFIGLIIALPLTTLIFSYYSQIVLHTPRKPN